MNIIVKNVGMNTEISKKEENIKKVNKVQEIKKCKCSNCKCELNEKRK